LGLQLEIETVENLLGKIGAGTGDWGRKALPTTVFIP
jgi:hypothetical protein